MSNISSPRTHTGGPRLQLNNAKFLNRPLVSQHICFVLVQTFNITYTDRWHLSTHASCWYKPWTLLIQTVGTPAHMLRVHTNLEHYLYRPLAPQHTCFVLVQTLNITYTDRWHLNTHASCWYKPWTLFIQTIGTSIHMLHVGTNLEHYLCIPIGTSTYMLHVGTNTENYLYTPLAPQHICIMFVQTLNIIRSPVARRWWWSLPGWGV